jgi:CRISPR-associated protein Cmr2
MLENLSAPFMSDGRQSPLTSLLKLQIGPVQEFIAQARSTRDLWSGSYLLSWLLAQAVKSIRDNYGEQALIFPAVRHQPLLNFLADPNSNRPNAKLILTPNLPNLLVAKVEAGLADRIAQATADVIRTEWRTIADACWRKLVEDSLINADLKPRFDRQVNLFLSITWQVTPWANDYAGTSRLNGWQLDAVRQTREFRGWNDGVRRVGSAQNKDSLTGREEAVCGGSDWWSKRIQPLAEKDPSGFWPTAFRDRQSGDLYGAISLVKRLWHRVYLGDKPWRLEVAKILPMPSTWQIARHDPDKNEDDEKRNPSEDKQGYFAVLAMDGDEMGKWLSGAKTGLLADEPSHREFSSRLSEFALHRAAEIVRQHCGCLIYSGGDDVLALLPADKALGCGQELRNQFRAVMKLDIDASVGIAIAHFTEPLQDVVRAAQTAEKRAKTKGDRSTAAVVLFKRSGETVNWHCKWSPSTGGGLDLLLSVQQALAGEQLSARFPHRVIELLSPYLLDPAEEGRRLFAPAAGFEFNKVVEREFAHALDRQSVKKSKAAVGPEVLKRLEAYLTQLDSFRDSEDRPLDPNDKLRALLGLLQTVAFIRRNEIPAHKTDLVATANLQLQT